MMTRKRHGQIRRHGVTLVRFAFVSLGMISALLFVRSLHAQSEESIRHEFKMPDKRYRPMVRWWWPGDGVTDAELRREIGLLDDAWFGGAEIQPFTLYFMSGLSKEEQAKISLGYGTPSFFEHVKTSVEEARSHGMWIDSTFGTGWPSGGGMAITPELASIELRYADTVVTGPVSYAGTPTIPAFTPDMYTSAMSSRKGYFPEGWQERFEARTRIVAVVALRSSGSPQTPDPSKPKITNELLDGESTVVLTDRLQRDGKLDWEVPPGKWHIFVFRQIPTRQLVVNASGQGPQLVLDHFDRLAFDAHAAHVGDPLISAIPASIRSSLRAVFVDSLEVTQYLAWSDDFLEQFKSRRGYDLVPYLPVLRVAGYNDQNDSVPGGLPFFDIQGGDAIRKDYWETVSELITERFYEPFDDWARQHNLKSRVQAHGAPADVLKIYGEASIPETEELGGNNTVNFMKLASSAGYDYGRPIVSSESFVFHGNPNISTPESLKANTDKMLVSGVNEIIYHGFPYKLDTGIKGIGWFPFRAVSTPVMETNPIWPYIGKVNRYITRLQYIAQEGASDLQVAIFRSSLNTDDTGPSPGSGALIDTLPDIEESLTSAGYSFGFVNQESILSSSVKDGAFRTAGGGVYKALVIPQQARIAPSLLRLLKSLASAHIPVIVEGGLPSADAGFKNLKLEREQVSLDLEKLTREHLITQAKDAKSLGAALSPHVAPQVRFVSGDTLPFIKKTIGSTTFYLLTNPAEKNVTSTIHIGGIGSVESWDPWTGEMSLQPSVRDGAGVSVSLKLAPFGSQLLALGKMNARLSMPVIYRQVRQQEVGTTGWKVTAEGNSDQGAGITLHIEIPKLIDWREIPQLKTFSGNAKYSTKFSISQSDLNSKYRIELDLGSVKDAAQVSINGADAGSLEVRPFAVDITRLLRPGENEVEVTVSNTLTNYVSSLKGSAVAPYQVGHFDALPSGLFGPVTLRYEEPVKTVVSQSHSPVH